MTSLLVFLEENYSDFPVGICVIGNVILHK